MNVYFVTFFLVMITSILAENTSNKYIYTYNGMKKIYNKFFVIITSMILIIVAGLRWRIGTDYWQYTRNYYRLYREISWSQMNILDEPGIIIISKISNFIYDDPATMFFLASLLTIGLFMITISKYSNDYTFSILLFVFSGVWHGSFNIVRQYIAVAIIFAGHNYIIKKNIYKFFGVVFLASLFHISALSMLILYFIPIKKLKLKYILLLFFSVIIILYSYNYIFDILGLIENIDLHTHSYSQREINSLRVLIMFAPVLFYYFFINKSKLMNQDFFYINLLIVNAGVWLAVSNSAYLARFGIYTHAFICLSIPKLMNNKLLNFDNAKLATYLKFITVFLFSLFWYFEVSKSIDLNNFKWIFERNSFY